MLKKIRIETGGPDANKIAKGDRRVHTTTSGQDLPGNPGRRVADQVQWLADSAPGQPPGSFTIRFRYIAGSPFAPGHGPTNPDDVKVPPGGPETVSQAPGTYKYDVYRNDAQGNPTGDPTDDPDVIIE